MKKFLFYFVLLSIFSACNRPNEIAISLKDNFPVLFLANEPSSPVIIEPVSKEKGSIGFSWADSIYWLRGLPDQSRDTSTIYYSWDTRAGKVILEADMQGIDVNFSLKLPDHDSLLPMHWYLNFAATAGEYFTGAFERVVDGPQTLSWKPGQEKALNLRGQHVQVKLKPTVSAYAPFYLSSNNYGFYVKGTWPGQFDFCQADPAKVQVSFQGPALHFIVYRASSPAEIVKKHALETGPSFVPPKWAFGPWRWRDDHNNRKQYYDGTPVSSPYNSEVTEDILMMEAYGIPCSAYWIDRPWATGPFGFDDYEFDTVRLPHPRKMINWLNSKDIELMLWIAPFVMGDMANYAETHHYNLVSKAHGTNKKQVLMDFTNPEARKWWGENGVAKLAKMGVKGFKLDRADGEKLTDSLHLRTYAGTSYRENYNDYPRQYVAATYDAVQPILGDDFVLFPRAQYTGSARYGAMWAGDTDGGEYGLRSAIIGMQRCAVMGYPNWASDIGGYWGSFDREVAMRWLGAGCFFPIMEVGPTWNKAFWDSPDTPSYDTTLIATWRLYAVTRTKIKDYVHQLSTEASKTGMPVIRPLFLTYPEQREAWNNWQTYMLGPDILVSAVWKKGVTQHKLYLPAGETWINAWDTTSIIGGGKYVTVDAAMYQIPVFIRKGSGISLGDLNQLFDESFSIASDKPDMKALEKEENW
ncbi:MAG TPA: TIM-barrel domain-containing protein [Bacteroidales bacterium]|nr:TIM-barrel domain-containing protein [Bacteroidales bacterium]